MRNVTVEYLQQTKSGSYQYRRRIPKILQERVKKREFIKVLGKTQKEALLRYGAYHEHVEHLISLAKSGVSGLSPLEQSKRLQALLESWEADPHSAGRDDNERTWREEAAESLVGKYQDPDTGQFIGVPEEVGAIASALTAGVPKELPQVTLTDAFTAYLAENQIAEPLKRKKQVQRFRRAEERLAAVLGENKRVCDLTRADARAWRDARIASGVASSTIRREKNDISAVVGFAMSELDAGDSNPFRGLQLPKRQQNRQEERLPLPQEAIEGVYNELAEQTELQRIWTLLDLTGARPSEIRMLRLDEIILDHEVPHIVIQEREGRSLKTSWANRKIPVIGAALSTCQEVVKENHKSGLAFPKYADERGMDRLSASLKKYIRKFTGDPKHVPYSLRHNMKDRMRAAEVFPETAKAIEGHAYGSGQDASYGSRIGLRQMQKALTKAMTARE